MPLRTLEKAPRPESSAPAPARPMKARPVIWPDGRIAPFADPAAERPWLLATLAMLAFVAATLGTLVVG